MRATVLAFFLCVGSVMATDGVVQRANLGGTRWSKAASWSTRTIPGPLDEIYAPGQPGTGRVRIRRSTTAVGQALYVGGEADTVGVVEVDTGSLIIKGPIGRIHLGQLGGSGTLHQVAGQVEVQNSLHVGYRSTSFGRYYLEGGRLQAAAVRVGSGRRTRGEVELVGSASRVITTIYAHGTGQSQLTMQADSLGLPQIIASEDVVLNGSLHLDLSSYAGRANELPAIVNSGSKQVVGGFTQILLAGGESYEVSYSGGNGNDVVLVRTAEPITSYNQFANHYALKTTAPRTAHKNNDDDGDGLTNLAEYKLGSSPVYAEPWDWAPTESNGQQSVRYSEQSGRHDAILVPQIQVNGQWTSDGVRTVVVSETAGGKVLDAIYDGDKKPFRLHAELLPDIRKPTNILLVVVDDLNDWVGCLGGHPQASTPNIDKLAARGCLFTKAYSNGVICNVSRSSFMTGVAPSTSKLFRNHHELRDNSVLQDDVTLPQHFMQNGFHTISSGKVLHDEEPDSWHSARPMTEFSKLSSPNPPPTSRGHRLDWHAFTDINDARFRDRKIGNHFINELKSRPTDKPFFAAVGFIRPHLPWYAPVRFFDRFPLKDVILPEVLPNDKADMDPEILEAITSLDEPVVEAEGVRREAVRAYLAATSFSDELVGRVVDWADSQPDSANTVIVLISDHGFHLGEKQHWRKLTLWNESTHIPMIIVAPGLVKPGSRRSEPVSLLDLYPTLTDIAGTKSPPGQLEGTSLVPLMQDPDLKMNRFILSSRLQRQHTLTDGNYRFVQYAGGAEEFYDLKNDPNEWHNLITDPQYDALVETFREHLPQR